MRALTLHAPWAWAICHLGKDIENRSWQPPATMIGERIAIHAGSKALWKWRIWQLVAEVWDEVDQSEILEKVERYTSIVSANDSSTVRDRFCSSIVATAVIESVLPPKSANDGWHMANQYGWKLTDVKVLSQPVPIARGMLGFWNLTPEQEAAVVAAGRLQ